jgi:hypothetical protein
MHQNHLDEVLAVVAPLEHGSFQARVHCGPGRGYDDVEDYARAVERLERSASDATDLRRAA